MANQRKKFSDLRFSPIYARSLTAMKASLTSGDIKETVYEAKPEGIFNLIGESSKLVVAGVATFVLYTRQDSWLPLYYILMSILNGVLSKALKSIIKEPRPPQSSKEGYGMPSSHTQAFFFFFAVISMNATRFLPIRESWILSICFLVYCLMATYWRVVTGVHTAAQTVVGAAVGLSFGAFVARNEISATLVLQSLLLNGKHDVIQPVPLKAKLFLSFTGFVLIYKNEIKDNLKLMLKRKKK
jgi:membrane-associated phospholipid phosphatase